MRSPGIAPKLVSATYARSPQAALAIVRRSDLAASLFNLLHGHHQHVSIASCDQAAVYSCAVWVTPIREQLSIAIACKQLGAGTGASVHCSTRPLDLTPAHAMSLAYPGTASLIARHGYTLAGERCDDPWRAAPTALG